MSRPHLSICIATRNRGPFIGETLDSIARQLTPEVEVVVLDGASTDNTSDVVNGFVERHSNVRYIRLPVNGGADQDFARCVDAASGEYCWLMTDDDVFHPGAIDAVLRETARAYSLIVVNAEVRGRDLGDDVQKSRLRFAGDRSYAPGEDEQLFIDTADYLSFIGGVVIRKDVWDLRNKERYFGSAFVHIGVIFQAPLPHGAKVLARPWIKIRYGNAQWVSQAFDIWMFRWPGLIWSFSQFSSHARFAVTHPEPWRIPRKLLICRATGTYSKREYLELVKGRATMFYRVYARLIAMLPGRAANMAVSLLRVLAYPDSGILQIDLQTSPYYWRRIKLRQPTASRV